MHAINSINRGNVRSGTHSAGGVRPEASPRRWTTSALKVLRPGMLLLVWAAHVSTWSQSQPAAYVANANDDTVSVVSLESLSVLRTVSVGDVPTYVAASPDGSRVYVVNRDSNSLSAIDTASGSVSATIVVGIAPAGLTVSRDGRRVYVANSGSASVSVIDTASDTVATTVPTPPIPYALAVHPVRDELWIAYGQLGTVVEVRSTSDYSVLASLTSFNRLYATALAFRPDGSELLTAEDCGFCGRFHVLSGQPAAGAIAILQSDILYDNTGSATALAVNPVSGVAYLGKAGQNGAPDVREFGGAGRSLMLGASPRSIAVAPDGQRLYLVIAAGVQSLGVVDTSTFELTATVRVGANPQGIALANFGPKPPVRLELLSASVLGDTADEQGAGISVHDDGIYVSGMTTAGGHDGIAARFARPLSNGAAPVWSTSWPNLPNQDGFVAIGATTEGAYAIGWSLSRTIDSVGTKEEKGIVVKFPLAGPSGNGYGGAVWDAQTPPAPGLFNYGGGEALHGGTVTVENGVDYAYVTGNAETGSEKRWWLAKVRGDSTLLWTANDRAERSGNASSFGADVVLLNGHVYVAGDTADSGVSRPYLRKYTTEGGFVWKQISDTGVGYHGIATAHDALYCVGVTAWNGASADFLIEKWDESGTKLWSRVYDRNSAEDVLRGVVAVGDRLFAVGSTRGDTAGGADVIILELDPATGDLVGSTLYGGASDDAANGAATDGTDLYVVGETQSYGGGGSDLLLLRYALSAAPPVAPTITTQPGDQTVPVDGTATFMVVAVGTEPLNYQWQKGQTDLVDGGRISGATTATLTISDVEASDAADYRVRVRNAFGGITSETARLNPEGGVEALWNVVTIPNLPAGAGLAKIWARTRSELYVWAHTTTPDRRAFLYRRDGNQWLEVLSVPGVSPGIVYGTGTEEVFASVQNDEAQRATLYRSLNRGQSWEEQRLPGELGNHALATISGTPGNVHLNDSGGHIFRFDGSGWSTVFSDPAEFVYALTLLTGTEGYYVTCWGWGRWDGGGWAFHGVQFDFCDVSALWGVRDGANRLHLYAVGNNNFSNGVRVWRFDEAAGTFGSKSGYVFADGDGFDVGGASGVWGSGANDVYVIGGLAASSGGVRSGRIYRYNGATWERVTEVGDIAGPGGITGTAADDVWVSLQDGRLLHRGQPGFTLAATTYLGGLGDQRGLGVGVYGDGIFICGIDPAGGLDEGLLARYAAPLTAGASPVWSTAWPGLNGGDHFGALAVAEDGLYVVGASTGRTTDSVGGKESKGITVKFPRTGPVGPGFGGSIWDRQTPAAPGALPYGGGEGLESVVLTVEGGTRYAYVAGWAEPGFFSYRGTLAKVAEDSTVVWWRTDVEDRVGTSWSYAHAVTALNGGVYLAGSSQDSGTWRPTLRKYDPAGSLVWKRTADQGYDYRGITAWRDALYAAGSTDTGTNANFLVEKWDEAGRSQWVRSFDRGGSEDYLTGIVGVGGRLYAVGSTRGGAAGGTDAIVLELDPATGDLLSWTRHGGAQDDTASGVATDGTDLYVVGETRSFGAGGNEVMLLRYGLPSPLEEAPRITVQPENQTIGAGRSAALAVTAVGSEPLGYQWYIGQSGDTANAIGGATATNYVTQPLTATTAFWVRVTNTVGSVDSQTATVTVIHPPSLTGEPRSVEVAAGGAAVFEVAATGTGPFEYQWRLNGQNLPGATNAILTITDVGLGDAGTYTVVVSNAGGTSESDPAVLTLSGIPLLELVDRFADRRLHTEPSGQGLTNNLAATREPFEPAHAGKLGGNSLWMTWQPSADGIAIFTTLGSSFDTLLAVYTGAELLALTDHVVASDEDSGGYLTSRLSFNARRGIQYQIAVDGFAGATGTVMLTWDLVETEQPQPEITRQPVGGLVQEEAAFALSVASDQVQATYQWSRNGEDLVGKTQPTLVFDSVGPADAGTYAVRVTRPNGPSVDSAEAVLEVIPRTAEPGAPAELSADKWQDLFQDELPEADQAMRLQGRPTLMGFTSIPLGLGGRHLHLGKSTRSPDDPQTCGTVTGASRWFRFRVDKPRPVELRLASGEIDAVLAAYGKRGGNWVPVMDCVRCRAGKGSVTNDFRALVGEDYVVMVAGVGDQRGEVSIEWEGMELEEPPCGLAAEVRDGRLRIKWCPRGLGPHILEWSVDLDTWHYIFRTFLNGDEFEYHDTEPMESGTHKFFRLRPDL